jgi:hypothetical protein
VKSIETEKDELRSRMIHLRRLQVLHIIATVFIILVFIFTSPHGGSGWPIVAGLVVCFLLVIWIIARLIKLMAEYARTVAKLGLFEFFPSIYETYGADVPDEITRRASLDAYTLNGAMKSAKTDSAKAEL